jgi:hypothetical protein
MAGKVNFTGIKQQSHSSVRYESVAAKLLSIDLRVQRDHLNKAKLQRMREKYDRLSLGTIVVSERADGSLIVLDGQHRWNLVAEIEGDDYELDCRIHSGLSLPEEAALFVNLNVQEAASPLDKHKARVTQGEPVAVAIDKAAVDSGWLVGTGKGRISAVKILEYLYYLGEEQFEDYGGELVAQTVRVVTKAWGTEDSQAVNRYILQAIGEFILAVEVWIAEEGKPSDYFEFDWLASNMNTYLKGGPKGWLTAQRGIAEGSELTLQQAMRQSLYRTYQKSKRSAKLPEFLKHN